MTEGEQRLQWARDWPEDVLAELDKARRKLDATSRERYELEQEVAYLRRQIALDDNWQDPEFGGCTPDPLKPIHLREKP